MIIKYLVTWMFDQLGFINLHYSPRSTDLHWIISPVCIAQCRLCITRKIVGSVESATWVAREDSSHGKIGGILKGTVLSWNSRSVSEHEIVIVVYIVGTFLHVFYLNVQSGRCWNSQKVRNHWAIHIIHNSLKQMVRYKPHGHGDMPMIGQ